MAIDRVCRDLGRFVLETQFEGGCARTVAVMGFKIDRHVVVSLREFWGEDKSTVFVGRRRKFVFIVGIGFDHRYFEILMRQSSVQIVDEGDAELVVIFFDLNLGLGFDLNCLSVGEIGIASGTKEG